MKINIFSELEFGEHALHLEKVMSEKIENDDPAYLLNVNETEYLQFVIGEFRIEPLEIDFEGIFIDPEEVYLTGDQLHSRAIASQEEPGRLFSRQGIIYHLPFSGKAELLQCKPNPFSMNTFPVRVEEDTFFFKIVAIENDVEQIKREFNWKIELIRKNFEYLAQNVQSFNASLPQKAKAMFEARRKILMERNNLVAALGIPIRMSGSVPQTFAVPTMRKRVIVAQPPASTEPYAPEPTLDQSIYQNILQVIQDTGRVFERLPSTYSGKREEDLRDHLLLVLEPHFENASTTGETFNNEGKTDILIRYGKKNVFVGECKFWKGDKVHMETIDQILSYLTYRDSKAAVIYFVRQKEMSSVLTTIETNTSLHPSFIAIRGRAEDTWFSYEFRLPGDSGRSIQLAIMCFHLPKSAKES